jgi:hypothetical protein
MRTQLHTQHLISCVILVPVASMSIISMSIVGATHSLSIISCRMAAL